MGEMWGAFGAALRLRLGDAEVARLRERAAREGVPSEPGMARLVAGLPEDFQAWGGAHPEATLLDLEVDLARRLRVERASYDAEVAAVRAATSSMTLMLRSLASLGRRGWR